jgi:hypothetical protein
MLGMLYKREHTMTIDQATYGLRVLTALVPLYTVLTVFILVAKDLRKTGKVLLVKPTDQYDVDVTWHGND